MIAITPDDCGTTLGYAWEFSKFGELMDAALFCIDKKTGEAPPNVTEAVGAMA